MPHNFSDSLAMSHAHDDLPLWKEVYEQAFPTMVTMICHRQDGDHQRNGIDRSIILANSKQITVDEKVRGKNRFGYSYPDIALEYLSDRQRNVPGWVCKPLQCDYIAYAIAPRGKCYLLPVPQLQLAWTRNKDAWIKQYKEIRAENECPRSGRNWTTISVGVPVGVLFPAIGKCLRFEFEPCELTE
jgi:hypothetical protein